MEAVDLRNIIFDKLNTVEDSSFLKKVLAYVESFKKESEFTLSDKQLAELDKRRNKHLKGEGKSFSWKEIKQELIEKHGLQS